MGLTKPRAAQIFDLDYKQSTRVVTVSNVTLSGGAPNSVDGVNLSLNDRILVTGQTTGSQNGIYLVTTLGTGSNGTWARTSDTNETGEIEAGMIVMVTEGTIYADTQWKLITNDPITVGTTSLTFTQNYSANSISSGTSNVVVNSNANVNISSAGSANVVSVGSTAVTFTGNLFPSANVTYTLGNTALRWKDLWLANSSLYIGDVVVATTGSALTINGANVLTGNAGAAFSTAGNITGGNLLTSGLVSATGNVTANYFLGNVACASGIFTTKIFNGTSEANIGTSGGNANITIGGTSNVAVFATTGQFISGLLSVTGNITSGNIAATNHTGTNVSVTGTVTAASTVGGVITGTSTSVTGTQTAASTVGGVITGTSVSVTGTATAASTVGGVITGTSVSVTGNVSTTGNVNAGNVNISGNIVDSGALTVITGSNGNIDLSPNGTGNVNTGANLSVTGRVTAASTVGGVITGSSVSVTGTATAASTVGGVITGSSVSVTGTATAASTVGGVITGSSASLSGNVSGGNLNVTGNIVDTGALTIITGSNGNINLAPNGTGIVTASGNISTTGNIFPGNILTNGYYYANGVVFGGGGGGTPGGSNTQIQFNDNGVFAGSAGLTFNKTTNAVSTTGAISTSGNITAAAVFSNGQVSSTGNVFAPNVDVSTGTVFCGNIVNQNANAVGNIGSSSKYFNTVFAKATSAQYADLAEMYVADTEYTPGTVVEFGGTAEITQTTQDHSTRVAGIISTNPSYLMNATIAGAPALPVALVGRVPCRVTGTIAKGDRLVASDIAGVATVLDPAKYQPACIIGKALENYDSTTVGIIEVAVGRT